MWNFKPLASPNSFDPLMVHMPARVVQHSGNHAVAITTIAPRQLDDVLGKQFFIGLAAGCFALGRPVLTKCLTSSAFRYAEGLADTVIAVVAARRA